MKKVLISLLLFVFACGPTEEEIQAQIDEAVNKATSTTSTIAQNITTTTVLPTSTTTSTTMPVSIIEVAPNIEIACEPIKKDDDYISFNIKITRGTMDIEVVNIVSWFDSTRTDNLFISEDMPENEGLSRELSYKVDNSFSKYEIEVLIMDTNDNFATDYCLYDKKSSANVATTTTTTTTTTIPVTIYAQNELDFYRASFKDYYGNFTEFVKWNKPEVTVSVQNLSVDYIQSIYNQINDSQSSVKFTVFENKSDADIKLYYGEISTWGNFLSECAIDDDGYGKSYFSFYITQKSHDILHDDLDSNSINKRVACFGSMDEHYERWKDLADRYRYRYTKGYWSRVYTEQIYRTILESVLGGPDYMRDESYCFYADETTKGSAGELYPFEKEPYKHVSCGESSYLSDQEFYKGFSKLDLKRVTIHYDDFAKNAKSIEEVLEIFDS
tara:strand:- start:13753 stop:15078 length:1326 start_codon:yes stop_codon:yes gene_type:complete